MKVFLLILLAARTLFITAHDTDYRALPLVDSFG